MNSDEIKEKLEKFIQPKVFYKHQNIKYTPGILFLVESCNCTWLIDYISYIKTIIFFRTKNYKILKLTVNKDKTAKLIVENNKHLILTYHDFENINLPISNIELYLEKSILYLKSEFNLIERKNIMRWTKISTDKLDKSVFGFEKEITALKVAKWNSYKNISKFTLLGWKTYYERSDTDPRNDKQLKSSEMWLYVAKGE